ncbi:MAG: type II secretion system F family protein [Deltaproteobacteria bacterium]|nr:type II secretion system F family protein [Deltaproteobacteria bacterium]
MWNITFKDFWYAATLAAILVAVILLMVAVYQLVIVPSRKRAKVSRRLKEGAQHKLLAIQILKEQAADRHVGWEKLLATLIGPNRLAKLRVRMQQADIHYGPGIFVRRSFYLVGLGLVVGGWALHSWFLGVLLGCGLGAVPFFFIKRKSERKTKKFEAQMPDAMELLARSLRAGHTLPSAIELTGEQMDNPMGAEMTIAYEEQQFGLSTSEVLLHMLDRVDSMDLRYFVAAVLIQQETGGNLAELMENIAMVIRSRLNFKSKVRSLTAMGRISTTIMIIAPIAAFMALMLVAHTYEKALLETSAGKTMLMTGGVLVFIGAYFLKKMIKAVET